MTQRLLPDLNVQTQYLYSFTMKKFAIIPVALCVLGTAFATAQSAGQPHITTYTFSNGATLSAMSPNGLWATAKGFNDASLDSYPYLINLTTHDTLPLLTADDYAIGISAGAYDVTNDGKIVVGHYSESPAFYYSEQGSWEVVENVTGHFNAVSPDGKYAVGVYSPNIENIFEEAPLFFENGARVSLEGLPKTDITDRDQKQNRLIGVSPDGNILLGCMSFSYPGSGCSYYVYDRRTGTHDFIGKGYLKNGSHVDAAHMSNNGKWITGTFNNVQPIDGETAYYNENYISYIYNVETREFTPLYNGEEDYDHAGNAVSNDGVIFGCSPYLNPSRSLQVRHGNFWYPLETILSSRYGVDYRSATGYQVTGLALDVSDDGRTIAAMAYITEENYILTLPETYDAAAAGVNLLSQVSFSPTDGTRFATISQIRLTFDRVVEYVGGNATIYKGEDRVRSSLSVTNAENGKAWDVGFRATTLEEDAHYQVVIPAGMFRIPGSEMTNPEYTVRYVGRAEKPVQLLSTLPADGGSLSELSYNSPVTLTFDIPVQLSSTAAGQLYQVGNETPLCDLTLAYGGNMVAAYPTSTRYLFKGSEYIVKIEAGQITDQMGNCGNDPITLHLTGLYERPLPADGETLIDQDFNDMSNSLNSFLLYEGDHNVPTSTMKSWGFDADNTPWNFSIRDDDAEDYCAASTSMYSTAGKSDNWMSTLPIYVPSADYVLTWKAQSYLKAKSDSLRVYIWESDEQLSALSAATVDKIRSEGKLVFFDRIYPGANENTLAGEWSNYSVDLAPYSGKNIYIVFADLNTNQSVLFVDDLKVEAISGHFSVGSLTETIITTQSETEVSGYVRIVKDTLYTDLTAYYHNADLSICDTIRVGDLNLRTGDVYRFHFERKLPVALGRITDYTIGVRLGNETREIHGKVSNLAFSPVKRVVVEKLTGAWCGNCPLGIVAFDYMNSSFKDNFIPIAIHTANGGSDLYDFSAYSNYLGLSAAPTGRVNRIDTVYSPICTDAATGKFSFTSAAGNETWTDILLRELEEGTLVQIDLGKCLYDATQNNIEVPVSVKFAVDMTSANYNVSFIILEDGLMSPQSNYFYNNADPLLGSWGQGGTHGSYSLVTYEHVARAVIGNYGGMSGYLPNGNISSDKDYGFTLRTSASAFSGKVAMANASVVCLLINANTGRIENAAIGHFNEGNVGIEELVTESAPFKVSREGQGVTLLFETALPIKASLHDLNGRLLDSYTGSSSAGQMLHLDSHRAGITILHVTTPQGNFVRRIISR